MFNIGPQELLVILLVALIIVGPKRLPELSRTIGRGLREFRKAQDEVTKTIRLGLGEAEPTAPREPTAAGRASRGSAGEETERRIVDETPGDQGAADVARTLGRGLAEIRRARREVQRTFRVDLSEPARPPRPRATSAEGPPADAAGGPTEPASPDRAETSGGGSPGEERPVDPEASG